DDAALARREERPPIDRRAARDDERRDQAGGKRGAEHDADRERSSGLAVESRRIAEWNRSSARVAEAGEPHAGLPMSISTWDASSLTSPAGGRPGDHASRRASPARSGSSEPPSSTASCSSARRSSPP